MIRVYPGERIATWQGFGGAITEAAAYNFSLLSPARQKAFLKAYFDPRAGLGYNFGRVAIGSNDFCLAPYELVSDGTLEDFAIEHERRYVLSMLAEIYKLRRLRLIASPWSPPSFMKTNNSLFSGGELKKRFYKKYAKYLRLFLEEYRAAGFPVEFLTPQNEPEAKQRWESCLYDFSAQRKLIRTLLPELRKSGTKILVWDHNKEKLFKVAEEIYRPFRKNAGVAGVGFHIYSGIHAEQMRLVREKYPEMLMINTESAAAFRGPMVGAAEYYLEDILTDMNCGVNAYVDWNLLLDSEGGPTDANNPVKAAVMLNGSKNDFVLTPIYDYLKVAAEAFPPGTEIIRAESDDRKLVVAAGVFAGELRVVLMNKSGRAKKYEILVEAGRATGASAALTGMITGHTILRR